MKKTWQLKSLAGSTSQVAAGSAYHPVIASILADRGYGTTEAVRSFLSPSLGDMLDPGLMHGMQNAVARLLRARQTGERICIYGDYDVDGITGTALLVSYLRASGFSCNYYIPSRFDEGYGINAAAVEAIAAGGANVIVSVDCGITAVAEALLCRRLGVDLIIVDHHTPLEIIPDAAAVLNPLQPACRYPFKSLAGVGVAFNLLVALKAALRNSEKAGDAHLPDLREWLDLVALGTIADVVPLTGQNRIYVSQGLKRMGTAARPGLRALKRVAGIGDGAVSCGQVGFRLAPRLNAAGRMESAVPGVDLLIGSRPDELNNIASELDAANAERQAVERMILEEAIAMVESSGTYPDRRSIVLASPDWHQGVVGIVASRLVERYHRPTLLIALTEDGSGKGSGRSIPGFNILEALTDCAEHLDRFGGHRYAAGISIRQDRIARFSTAFEAAATARLCAEELQPKLMIDIELEPSAVTRELVEALKELEPFGMGNPEPLLMMRRMSVTAARVVGDGHLRLRLSRDGYSFAAIAFKQAGRVDADLVDIVFFPEMNEWNGTSSLQLRVKDLRKAE